MGSNIRKLRQSFHFAARGVVLCLKNERNFRIHLCAALYASALAAIAGFEAYQYAILFLCFASVMSTELLNTAIERTCDLIGAEYSTRIKAIKDISAGAVLIAAFFAFLTGAALFLRREAIDAFLAFSVRPAVLIFVASVPVAVFFIIGKGKR